MSRWPSGYTSLVCLGRILDLLGMVWFSLDGDWFLLFLSLLVSVFNWFFISGVFEFLSLLESGGAKSPATCLYSTFYNEEESMVLCCMFSYGKF